jgi:hypothetical protein
VPPDPPIPTATVTEDNRWVVTYTPMGTWVAGMLAVTGQMTVRGTWTFDVEVGIDADTSNAMLSTPTPLTLTPSCATGISAGVVKGTYGEDQEITVTWTACGERTVTSS